ncbi:hypothetical protein PENSUB_6200 [Penicillium subrubescens]|uniref:Uncharacterized protein n=1 Tax=Penicillium subrubescens TaxID=1316194 RepID=A0A1Q5U2M3_9EURO|nr:hypothetical protein PENSUB_6200 [Penicillium subrubescens]
MLGVESVHWVGRVALSREGRLRLNLDRLGQRIVAAMEEAKQYVGLHSPFGDTLVVKFVACIVSDEFKAN